MDSQTNVMEQWNVFEIALTGPSTGNPFKDVTLSATFSMKENDTVQQTTVGGFYDGNGTYFIRFMPSIAGEWNYVTTSNIAELSGKEGTFTCAAATKENHGPVSVKNQYHFGYADGTPYFPFGTTCYAWTHQSESLQEETLETLKNNCFNKLRMCVFPKSYANNSNEPPYYPYEGTAPTDWDLTKFNPEFWHHLEKRIGQLTDMGIQVDLILFHPYDKGHWNFDSMGRENDDFYLNYVIARLGAFKNIWWSVANEYDFVKSKTKEDWDHYIELLSKNDPYHHLLSIHNAHVLYDYWSPYITHASIQLGTLHGNVTAGMGRLKLLRDAYHKPVIYDEVGYEGNLVQRWGQQTPEELMDKFWQSIISGTYCTHGETFTHPDDIIWWSKGGKLKGKSPARIAFLKKIIEDSGYDCLEPLDLWWCLDGVGKHGDYYLYYFSYEKLSQWKFALPAFKTGVEIPYGTKFQVEIIDAWNMTITKVPELFEVTDQDRYTYTCNFNPYVELPNRPFMGLRITKVKE